MSRCKTKNVSTGGTRVKSEIILPRCLEIRLTCVRQRRTHEGRATLEIGRFSSRNV